MAMEELQNGSHDSYALRRLSVFDVPRAQAPSDSSTWNLLACADACGIVAVSTQTGLSLLSVVALEAASLASFKRQDGNPAGNEPWPDSALHVDLGSRPCRLAFSR
jgi:hypothetical protein